jgi:hypothetical protein
MQQMKIKKSDPLQVRLDFDLVPKARLELARPFEHTPLKRACLPIPPLRQRDCIYTEKPPVLSINN